MSANLNTPLWQLRCLQNWAKEVLIKELCPTEHADVVQVGGSGFDTGKWERSHVSFVLNVEREESKSVEAENRWRAKGIPFKAKFLTTELNCDLRALPDMTEQFGRFSLMMSSDTTLEMSLCRSAKDLIASLESISLLLAPKGFWCGICFDSSEIWSKSPHSSTSATSSSYSQHGSSYYSSSGGSGHSSSYGGQRKDATPTKSLIYAAQNNIKIEIKQMARLATLEADNAIPRQNQLFSEWLPSAPTLGIEFDVTMEQKTETLSLVHIATLITAAKQVGMKCVSFTNLAEFFDLFRHREDELLHKTQVMSKTHPKLLPEQREAASFYAVYVFQKTD